MAECLQRQRNGLLLQVSHNEDSKIHVNQGKPVPACTVRSPYRDLVIGSGVVEGGGVDATINVPCKQYMAECLPLSGSKLIAVCRCIDRRS